jgi:hypothetical protein
MTESDARAEATAAIRTSLAPFGAAAVQQALDRLEHLALPADPRVFVSCIAALAREVALDAVRVRRRRVEYAEAIARALAQPIVGPAN